MSAKPRIYILIGAAAAGAAFAAAMLLMNISERKQEARERYVEVVRLTEDTVDPAVWGRNFPRQYDSFKRTAEMTPTRFGGSEPYSRLDRDPRLKRIFAGYAFALEYKEE
ncbi:MAG TPA: ammonia-forming cytochrome c nitrite reductase subunit c552, partial [Bryobacteraceae bacterium]|nr:ammonia-forming cytochrome c nitrite reductase subunit c552 [Bryobacteraceae bacterium]